MNRLERTLPPFLRRLGTDEWRAPTRDARSRRLCWEVRDGIRLIAEDQRLPHVDVKLVCAHKGISYLSDNGSPRDVGPSAVAFPDIDFVIYHSGYELPFDDAAPENAYRAHDPQGINRLLVSLDDVDVPIGANVYAELGSTWFCLVSRPVEAAHVLGKLIQRMGEDNVVWGTDSIWFGSPQPIIDAFRTFQIPPAMCEEFGYTPITDAVRAKILGENAARVYDIDLDAAVTHKAHHDATWAVELADRYHHGLVSAFRSAFMRPLECVHREGYGRRSRNRRPRSRTRWGALLPRPPSPTSGRTSKT